MSDYNVNNSLVEEAKSILHGLKAHQKNAEEKLSNLDRQVEDLKVAQKKMSEAYTKAETVYTGKESHLSRYIRKDGTLRAKTERDSIAIHGQGVVDAERKGLLDDTPVCEWQDQLQKIVRKRNFARMLMANPHTPKMDLELHKHLELAPKNIAAGIQRFYAGGAGAGAEWTQAQFVDQLHEDYKVPRRLRSLLREVPVERGSLIVPTLSRGGQPYVQSTISDDNPYAAANQYKASTVTTAQSTISMAGMTVRYLIDQAAMEDSALALSQILSRDIAESIESGFEDAMINGQTGAVGSFDTDLANWSPRGRWTAGATSDHRLAFDGFRKIAKGKSQVAFPSSSANFLFEDFVGAVAKMGEYGASEENVLILSPECLIKHFLDLDELATIDKFGPSATILSGQLGSLMGMPVVLSRFMTADLNALGIYDGVTTDKTGYVIFNRGSYVQYVRRGLQVETQRDITSGSMTLVASMRAVMGTADSAGAKNVVYSFNMDG